MRCLPLAVVLLSACTPLGPSGLPTPGTRPDTGAGAGTPLQVVGYNVESGDATPERVASNMSEVAGEVLWGFSEAQNQDWLDMFAVAANDGDQYFETAIGTTGGADKLGIVYDAEVMELLDTAELPDINIHGSARAPFIGHFRLLGSGVEFKFMVNHLWRTDEAARHEQAALLNDWAAGEDLPIVAVGDYNFDWEVEGGEADHDAGFDLFVANGVWQWVRPDELVRTQCSQAYNSVLDFVFVANDAKNWAGESTILFQQNIYCQESPDNPDHRPVQATFTVPDP